MARVNADKKFIEVIGKITFTILVPVGGSIHKDNILKLEKDQRFEDWRYMGYKI